jgi:hypothetical protein
MTLNLCQLLCICSSSGLQLHFILLPQLLLQLVHLALVQLLHLLQLLPHTFELMLLHLRLLLLLQ